MGGGRSLEGYRGMGRYNSLGGGRRWKGTKCKSLRGCRSMGVGGGRSI